MQQLLAVPVVVGAGHQLELLVHDGQRRSDATVDHVLGQGDGQGIVGQDACQHVPGVAGALAGHVTREVAQARFVLLADVAHVG